MYTILIGLIAGYIANRIMSKKNDSIIIDILIGVIGSWAGHFIFNLFGLGSYSFVGEILIASIGSCVVIKIFEK